MTDLRDAAEYFDSTYFEWQGDSAERSARAVVPLVVERLHPASVVDVGCGSGAWLKVFGEHGVADVVGIDAPYVEPEALRIEPEEFLPRDLGEAFRLDRNFDLAISLEAAHYVPEEGAATLVASIAALAPAVLFGAAVPDQGGGPGRNRQWERSGVGGPLKMHDDEIDVPLELVQGLVAAQFPDWAGLELELLLPWGTDNALYRLGDDKLVRLPRTARVVGQVEKDVRWLPRLAPRLPVAIPEVLATSAPAPDYPWTWGVYRWLEGETLPADRLGEAASVADDLARFLTALRCIPTAGAPPPRSRGVPLATRDDAVCRALADLGERVDTGAARSIWEAALLAPEWRGPPTWIHGDLMPGNLIVRDGRLSAVIDWSLVCAGDPACDLMAAWMFLGAESRPQLRAALDVDDATWMRGRGWALSCALIALPYYWETNPPFAAYARRTLAEVLSDSG